MAEPKPGRRRCVLLRFTHLVTACYDEEYLRLHDGAARREIAASCESVLQSKLAGGNKIVAFASRKH